MLGGLAWAFRGSGVPVLATYMLALAVGCLVTAIVLPARVLVKSRRVLHGAPSIALWALPLVVAVAVGTTVVLMWGDPIDPIWITIGCSWSAAVILTAGPRLAFDIRSHATPDSTHRLHRVRGPALQRIRCNAFGWVRVASTGG
jgi:hypothetical protein